MLNYIKSMVSLFTKIATGVVLVTAGYIQIFWGADTELSVHILWEDLIVAAVCSLCIFAFPLGEREVTKYSMLIRCILSYIYVNAVVLISGFHFGWFELSNWKQVLGMIVAIAIVFTFVWGMSYCEEREVAAKMNEKLRERDKEG